MQAAREYGVEILLVGPQARIEQELAKIGNVPATVQICNATQEIEMREHPANAFHVGELHHGDETRAVAPHDCLTQRASAEHRAFRRFGLAQVAHSEADLAVALRVALEDPAPAAFDFATLPSAASLVLDRAGWAP